MPNLTNPIQIADEAYPYLQMDAYGFLEVCVCEEHLTAALEMLDGRGVLLHYKDTTTGEIKVWEGSKPAQSPQDPYNDEAITLA